MSTASSSSPPAADSSHGAEVLDTRGMEPPEPILVILKRVSELPPGASLEVRLDNNPFQLYDLLQQRGYLFEPRQEPDGSFAATLRPRNKPSAH